MGFLNALASVPLIILIFWIMHKVAQNSVSDEEAEVKRIERELESDTKNLESSLRKERIQLASLRSSLQVRYCLVFGIQVVVAAVTAYFVLNAGLAWWQ